MAEKKDCGDEFVYLRRFWAAWQRKPHLKKKMLAFFIKLWMEIDPPDFLFVLRKVERAYERLTMALDVGCIQAGYSVELRGGRGKKSPFEAAADRKMQMDAWMKDLWGEIEGEGELGNSPHIN